MAEQQRSGFKGHGNYGQYNDYMTNHRFVANNAKNTAKGAGYPNQYYKQLLNKQSQNKARANAEEIETGSGHLTDLVSPKFRDQIEVFVDSQSKKQWELKQLMDKMDPNNPEYLELKKQREQIKSSYGKNGTLFNQLKEYQQRGIDWTEDYANSNFSVTSDETDTSALAEIYGKTGTAQMSIDESGSISFGNEDMGYTALSSLPDYQNKAYKSSKVLLSSLTKAYSEGKLLDDNGILLAKNSFTDLMNEEGVDGTMSLAFDNLLDPNNSLLNIDDYENVIAAIKGDDAALALEAEKILTQDLEAAYMGKLKQQHQSGFDDLNKASNDAKNKKFNAHAYIQGEITNIANSEDLDGVMASGTEGNLWEANLGPSTGNYRLRWFPGEGDKGGIYKIQKGQGSSSAEYKWVDIDGFNVPGGKMNGANRKELAAWLNSEIGWIKTKPESQYNFEINPDLDIEAEETAEQKEIDYVPETVEDKKKQIDPKYYGMGTLAGPK